MKQLWVGLVVFGLLMLVFGIARADDRWQVQRKVEDWWEPWISPKGYTAAPLSLTACLIDLASARAVDPAATLDCKRVK